MLETTTRRAAAWAAGTICAAVVSGTLSTPALALPPAWDVQITCTEDVVLPGEPGDYYNFSFASSCKPIPGVFGYIYNKLPDGEGWVTGIGFLGVPSNLGDFYNSHTTFYGSTPDPGEWNSSVIDNVAYGLTPMDAIQLQDTNYQGEPLGGAGSVVGAVVIGSASYAIYWGTAAPSGGSSGVPDPTYTLTSNADDRGTCWPTVSGVGGTWVQLTDSGCTPPAAGATLLGWATSPTFPVGRARNGVAVDEEFGGVRMIFIPVNGYTFLSGDNTVYPIWSS